MKKKIDCYNVFVFVVLTITIFFIFILFLPFIDAEAETMCVNVSEGSHLNGRAEPDKRAHVECRFYKGDEVNVLEIVDGWAKLDGGGESQYCYVSLDYLASDQNGPTTMCVTANGRVRVREKPSDNGKVVDYVRDGDVMTVSLLFDGWAKTPQGWINTEYLEGCK